MDERFRMMAALELTCNRGGKRILTEKAFGSTLAKLRQGRFVAEIAKTIRDGVVITPKGRVPVAVFSVPGKEIFDCVGDITRGLLANFYPDFSYHGHYFLVLDIHSATLVKGQEALQRKVLDDLITKTPGDQRGVENEFRFWRQVESANGHGAWLLVFYEVLAFVVFHSQAPFPPDIAQLDSRKR